MQIPEDLTSAIEDVAKRAAKAADDYAAAAAKKVSDISSSAGRYWHDLGKSFYDPPPGFQPGDGTFLLDGKHIPIRIEDGLSPFKIVYGDEKEPGSGPSDIKRKYQSIFDPPIKPIDKIISVIDVMMDTAEIVLNSIEWAAAGGKAPWTTPSVIKSSMGIVGTMIDTSQAYSENKTAIGFTYDMAISVASSRAGLVAGGVTTLAVTPFAGPYLGLIVGSTTGVGTKMLFEEGGKIVKDGVTNVPTNYTWLEDQISSLYRPIYSYP